MKTIYGKIVLLFQEFLFNFESHFLSLYLCFAFRFPINISRILVREGDTVQIPVNRAKGLNDRVEVKWECNISMKNDAIPISGVIKFEQVTLLCKLFLKDKIYGTLNALGPLKGHTYIKKQGFFKYV